MNYSIELNNFRKKNKEVFDGIGSFPDTMKIKLTEGVISIEETLKLLRCKGIIQPVNEPLQWVNNIAIIEKQNKSLRICIDPNKLNKHIVHELYSVPTLGEITSKLNNTNIFCVFEIKDAFYHIKLDEQ